MFAFHNKPKLFEDVPAVTVIWWDKNTNRHEYRFKGKIDWGRLRRETTGEGAVYVRIKNYDAYGNTLDTLTEWLSHDGKYGGRHSAWLADDCSEDKVISLIRRAYPPDWWHEGWWVKGMGTGMLSQVGGKPIEPVYGPAMCPATLDDLSFTRNGVKMWAWEIINEGEMRVSAYSDSIMAKYGSFSASRGDGRRGKDYCLLRALIGDAPVIPWEQWKELTKTEK